MNAFSRSWELTKVTFDVINKDKELLGFAFLSFFFSTLFMIAMIFPTIISKILESGYDENTLHVTEYVILFVTYFGLAFIATFFNVCVVYTTKIRFEGGNATFGESFQFALSRIGLIFQWSLLSATVGLLLRLIENAGKNFGKIGQIVTSIIVSLLGMAWSIMTIFVVPVLVYEGLAPGAAVKKSIEVIKKTWGENLIKAIGLGLVQFLIMFALILIAGAISIGLAQAFGITGLLIGIGIGVLTLLLVGLIFNVANTIFNTALYVYANQGAIATGFSEDNIRNAFKVK
ncbi:MAG: glycerophosphoryl diester phosphodiesterase membrane domain-containing protein [Bacteroidetes bacterium]|nr:glycerophosphoryl diester phosphodiesterase membrane domain-containing protein [Bacteroidota bacterium]